MWGGKREGSGRKKKAIQDKKVQKTVLIDPELYKNITKKYTDLTFSKIVEKALKELNKN